jgi:uncharacterized protein
VRPDFQHRYGPWALVTGASSGIGEAIARKLARSGMNLALCARRKNLLDALGEELARAHVIKVRTIEVDLSRADFLPVVEEATRDLDIGLLVNNAGFGDKMPFLESSLPLHLRMLDTNCRAVLVLTHAYAPRLAARGRGGILFTSSMAAFQGLPFSSHYAATKGYELQLAEGLWYELRDKGVDVVALCAGPTETEGTRRTGVDPDKVPGKMMDVHTVAEAGLDALGRGPIALPGISNRLLYMLQRLVPRRLATVIGGRMVQRVTT